MDCPDCGAEVDTERNELSEREWTMVLFCQSCSFEIETESNLVQKERNRRMREQADVRV
jgi:DNA-directed RNA polymerase subunit RPC12/RpoP